MTEWNQDKIMKLIELYRSKPVIWDPREKDYYNKQIKANAWLEIGAIMNLHGDECKQKMINILSSWRRERTKVNKSIATGMKKIYKSRWFAYKALDFLKERGMPKKGDATEESDSEDKLNTPNMKQTLTEPPQSKRLKPNPPLQISKETSGASSSTTEPPGMIPFDNGDSELKSFCDLIFQKMKKYKRHTLLAVQQEIMNIIFRADQATFAYQEYYDDAQPSTSNSQQYLPLLVNNDPDKNTYVKNVEDDDSYIDTSMSTNVSPKRETPSPEIVYLPVGDNVDNFV